ncbi:MFS transporter [Zafaria sp. Z1313]|uniref:MFS transporter n=1 Tax=unclassified Zafaria TaxID=2828765 RepID=UPI002E7922BB|nr:MFS transporter [Zafaria sp. J156]MEE1620253.1 MFS transporter [Zafaria sp. J156]
MDSARSWLVWGAGVSAYLIAVTQRTSFGVAGLQATERFDATASILATFSVVQLIVYAGLQIPVGLLVDRLGARAMITGGALLMVVGQALLALADSVAAGLLGRFFVGAGDAMTFVSVIRLLPAWFSGYRIPMLTQFTGMVGQLGQLLSLVPFVAVLKWAGWTNAFLSLAALGGLAVVLAVVVIRNEPAGAREAPPVGGRPKTLAMLAAAWRQPGTRLGFWTHFGTQFSANLFLLSWGYPFLVSGQGLAPATASALMSIFVAVALLFGPVFGSAVSRHPLRRSTLALAIIASIAAGWAVVLLWPGPAPVPVLVVLLVVVAIGGPGSMIGFDFARTFNPPHVIGTATGIVNVGGFLAALVSVYAVGAILDAIHVLGGGTGALYTLEAFRWALAFQLVPLVMGAVGILGARRKVRAALAREGVVVRPILQAVAERRRSRRGPGAGGPTAGAAGPEPD